MKGQVWIETVIYTLVGLTLIGLVLGVVTPKVNEYRDKAVIEQTITAMNVIDSTISEVLVAPGNARVVELRMKRGNFEIESGNNTIIFILEDSNVQFSEPNVETGVGRVSVLTTETQNTKSVRLSLQYNFDLQGDVKLTPATTPYKLRFENLGVDSQGNVIVIATELGA